MTTVENNTFTGPNAGIVGGYVPLTTIESTSMDGDLDLVKDDLDYHLSILQAIYTKLDTIETGATATPSASAMVSTINTSAELIDADNLESTVALLSNIISDIEAHRITTIQSAMHSEDSIKSTDQTYSYTPNSIVTSCQNILDEINNVRIQIHKILGQSTWIDTPNTTLTAIKTKLDTIETNATIDQIASEVPNTPAGSIIATDVQAAIDELDTEKETPAGAQTKIDTHAADTLTHGVAEIADKATVSTEIDNDITTHAALDTGVHGAGASTLATIDDLSAAIPSGVILPFGGAAAPSGYLLCDGAAISRTTYSALFAVTGTSYGVGNGSTTFNVPDLGGNIPVGIGGSGVTNRGDTGGEQAHELSIAELAAHTHSVGGSVQSNLAAGSLSNFATGSSQTGSVGSGNGHNTMQPYVGTEYIIKT